MPKIISKELKQKLVSLYETGELVKKICTEYNIQKCSLYNWIYDYIKVKTQEKLVFTRRQVYLLQKVLALLKEENEILNLKLRFDEYINFFYNERSHQRLYFKTPKQTEDNYISRSNIS